jgi:hypothetical protein
LLVFGDSTVTTLPREVDQCSHTTSGSRSGFGSVRSSAILWDFVYVDVWVDHARHDDFLRRIHRLICVGQLIPCSESND